VLLDDPDVSTRLQQLRAAGIRIALDDFGTGWSSLDYLRRFPVDQLKLDRSFTFDIADGAGGRAIPAAVIQLATTLGMDVVAEGVETQQHRACLIELGFDASQGYLFSAALPAIEARELLKRVNRPLGPRAVVRTRTAG
jgi:EAL domain-containing protein (putative c-di-GMP-specific phosphodiesterase class I)